MASRDIITFMIAVRRWRSGRGVRSCQSHIRCGPSASARLRRNRAGGVSLGQRGSTSEDKMDLLSAASFTICVSLTFTQQIQSLFQTRTRLHNHRPTNKTAGGELRSVRQGLKEIRQSARAGRRTARAHTPVNRLQRGSCQSSTKSVPK